MFLRVESICADDASLQQERREKRLHLGQLSLFFRHHLFFEHHSRFRLVEGDMMHFLLIVRPVLLRSA